MALAPRDWVILDGDNTLWDVESLYDRARERLCAFVESLGGDPEWADYFQRERDALLFKRFGYSCARFPQSFVDTVVHLLGRNDASREALARSLGNHVFSAIAEPVSSVDEALQRLRKRFRLALLTAGDPVVQKHRLDSFGRTASFTSTRVVPQKDVPTLRSFLTEHHIECHGSWVIGDSIRSDIEPAVSLGLGAIHLDAANWHPVERGERNLPTGALQVQSLLQACEALGC